MFSIHFYVLSLKCVVCSVKCAGSGGGVAGPATLYHIVTLYHPVTLYHTVTLYHPVTLYHTVTLYPPVTLYHAVTL